MMDALGNGEFARVRIGVGRGLYASGEGNDVVDHVLGRFDTEEARLIAQLLARIQEAVVTILREGIVIGMNRFNGK